MYPNSSNHAVLGGTHTISSEDATSARLARASTPVHAVDSDASKAQSQAQVSTPTTTVFTRQCTGSTQHRTSTPISNYAGLNFSATSKGDNIAQLRFTDSPIEVKCRTRGGSRSPFLSSFQTELKLDLDLSTTHACALALSERTSPVQATTPVFDNSGCGSFPQLVSRRAGNEVVLLTPRTQPRMSGSVGSARMGATAPQNSVAADESNRRQNLLVPLATPRTHNTADSTPAEEGQDCRSGSAMRVRQLSMAMGDELAAGAEAGLPGDEAGSGDTSSAMPVAPILTPTVSLPPSVVHRVLQGRCRFIAFPTNLPVVRCKNSTGGPSGTGANSSGECHDTNTNNNNNTNFSHSSNNNVVSDAIQEGGAGHEVAGSTAEGMGGGSSGGMYATGMHASAATTTPATPTSARLATPNTMTKHVSKSKTNEATHALFIGQVRFETTPAELIWLVQRTTGACASHLESRGAGCYLLYCKSEADLQLVRCLHKRVLFDVGGVWLARTAEEIDALCEHIALDAAVLSRKARLPRDSMVVEDLKVDGGESNKHNGVGGVVGSSSNYSCNHAAGIGASDYSGGKIFSQQKHAQHFRHAHHGGGSSGSSNSHHGKSNDNMGLACQSYNNATPCYTAHTNNPNITATPVNSLNNSFDIAYCTASSQLALQGQPSGRADYPYNTTGNYSDNISNGNTNYGSPMSLQVASDEDIARYSANSGCYNGGCTPLATTLPTPSPMQHSIQTSLGNEPQPFMTGSAASMCTTPHRSHESAAAPPPPYRY